MPDIRAEFVPYVLMDKLVLGSKEIENIKAVTIHRVFVESPDLSNNTQLSLQSVTMSHGSYLLLVAEYWS